MGETIWILHMMAILSLFLMAKFGTYRRTSRTYLFHFFIFRFMYYRLLEVLIADKTKNFKGTILIGFNNDGRRYFLIAIPTGTPVPERKIWYVFSHDLFRFIGYCIR